MIDFLINIIADIADFFLNIWVDSITAVFRRK